MSIDVEDDLTYEEIKRIFQKELIDGEPYEYVDREYYSELNFED
jgi:hypothetical protein